MTPAVAGKRSIDFWKSDWFVGLAVSVLGLAFAATPFPQGLERKAYALAMGFAERPAAAAIAIIAIDNPSIDQLGAWPWPRNILADMIEKLAAAQAGTIASTVFFADPQHATSLAAIDRLTELNTARLAAEAAAAPVPESLADLTARAAADPLARLLAETEQTLNTDRRLAEAMGQAGNVVLPVHFRVGEPLTPAPQRLPAYVALHTLKTKASFAGNPIATQALDTRLVDRLGLQAAAVGHLNTLTDDDGVLRSEPLALRFADRIVPSLALAIAARHLNLASGDIQVYSQAVKLGKLRIATDSALRMRPHFYAQTGAFPIASFAAVVGGKIPYSQFRDKIVLIGLTADGMGHPWATPIASSLTTVDVLAHTLSSLLSGHAYVAPDWGMWVGLGLYLLAAAYLIFAVHLLSAGIAAAATTLLFCMLVALHGGLLLLQQTWLPLLLPALLLPAGHLLLSAKRLLVARCVAENTPPAENATEAIRLYALALMKQGQLEPAFEQFRKCRLDGRVREDLYRLGLDFEHRHAHAKAETVFRYLAEYDLDFRDLVQRIAHNRQMAAMHVADDAASHIDPPAHPRADRVGEQHPAAAYDNAATDTAQLGRYRIEEVLGKGAMGIVYRGIDPTINRTVALKTLALSQAFDASDLAEVKARFFREAETAGRLNHANIVAVYDAGEAGDLAYIAMEFVDGEDLSPYTRPGHLLPTAQVLDIVARIADALDYAHAHQIVHRDIKPANLMYAPERNLLKVTDFGIARITDASRTKTGMVLGTPAYMSPEQLAGKKIDGRSDLFSLGVVLFQLCSGQLPFIAKSMTELMIQIASDPHPDLRQVVPGSADCIAAIIDRALAKDPDRRYQTGEALAADLRACLALVHGEH